MPDPLVFPFRGGFEVDDASHVANLRTLEIWARNFKPSRQERFNAGTDTFTNLGAGPTEPNAQNRFQLDLAGYTEARILGRVTVAGATGILKAQYSLDGTSFSDLTAGFSMGTTGIKASAWTQIPAAAKTLVEVRKVGSGGNGVEDPQIWSGVSLEWR
jgi:hypothetical protein